MGRRVAIVGVGLTKCSSHRKDVTYPELIYEAVSGALAQAGVTPKDVGAVVFGSMDPFDGVFAPERWNVEACAGAGFANKPFIKITTGGTTGGSVGHGAYYAVASGQYDVALAVAWEKHSDSLEAGATTGLMHVAMANFFHALNYGLSVKSLIATTAVGAAAGAALYQARFYMHRSGCGIEHLDMVAAKDRRNAAKNPYAHLQIPNCRPEDVAKTEMVAYPFRYGHICPASDGASAIVVASEEIARKKCQKPAYITGLGSYSDEENQMQSENMGGIGVLDASEQMGARMSAKKAYKMAGITDPKTEIHLAEIYQPFPSQELLFAEKLGLFDEGQAWKGLEKGETDIAGRIPCDLSGGVNATNAIGSSALQRILECALQIQGKAGEHQAHREVKNAVAHGWGGVTNYITVTVLSDTPRR